MLIERKELFLLLTEMVLIVLSIIFNQLVPALVLLAFLFVIMGIDPRFNILLLIIVMGIHEALPGISLGNFSIAPMHILLFISYLYLIIEIVTSGKFDISIFKNIFFYLLIAFILICTMSIFVAADKIQSLRYLRNIISWTLFSFYITYYIKSFNILKKIVEYWIYMAFAVSLLGILQLIFNIDYLVFTDTWWTVPRGDLFFRINSTFRDPNMLGNFLIAPLLISLSTVLISKNKNMIFFTIFIFITILFTNSRGAALASIFGILMIYGIGFWGIKHLARIGKSLISIITVFALFIYFLPHSAYERFLPSAFKIDWANLTRLFYIYISIKMIGANFFWGVGINNFPVVFRKYTPEAIWESLTQGYAKGVLHGGGYSHNTFLTIWAETGVLNVIVITFFILLTIKLAVIIKRNNSIADKQKGIYLGLIVGLWAVLIHDLTITYLTYHTFLLIGFIISTSYLTNYKENEI